MKYVIFEFLGVEIPVIFPSDILNHCDVELTAKMFDGSKGKPVSAGTCNIMAKDEVYVSGDSFSLGIKSRKEDAEIIKNALTK